MWYAFKLKICHIKHVNITSYFILYYWFQIFGDTIHVYSVYCTVWLLKSVIEIGIVFFITQYNLFVCLFVTFVVCLFGFFWPHSSYFVYLGIFWPHTSYFVYLGFFGHTPAIQGYYHILVDFCCFILYKISALVMYRETRRETDENSHDEMGSKRENI